MDAALLAHQMSLEKLFNKNQLLHRIRQEFETCKEPDFAQFMQASGIPVKFGMDLLTQIALHKRASLPTMVGILRNHFPCLQDCADMLRKAAELDLINWIPATEQFVVIFTISDDVQAELDRYQFPLPMVIEPKEVKDNRDNGYITSRDSIILKKNHHDDDVCLDHINRVNKINFAIDYDTATMIANEWRNHDKPKSGETKLDFEKRKRAFEKYDRTAKEVIDQLLAYGNEFYLTHKYDKRGRIYCQGYHVNYQGAPWNKAVISLADKELVE